MTDIGVRAAADADSAAIAELLTLLGYPVSEEEAKVRLNRLGNGAGVLVGEVGGEVVGVIGFSVTRHLERAEPSFRITALAVRPDRRRMGVGTALIDAAAEVARREGCFRLEVTCRPGRAEARAFYPRAGFSERPVRLVRELRRP
jgi:GNAT superfamily N-acetyltransferase